MPPPAPLPFADLNAVAVHLRQELQNKKFILLYAHNGTGKTRLSGAFKDLGKQGDRRDTLYFNAFTEDLFSWDNDLENDRERVLKINSSSRFFAGLAELEMDILHTRLVNILSHGRYSLYEPQEMLEENKRYFRRILHDFIAKYPFNPVLFPPNPAAQAAPAAPAAPAQE